MTTYIIVLNFLILLLNFEMFANESTTASSSIKAYTDEEALACSLENPEECEACQ